MRRFVVLLVSLMVVSALFAAPAAAGEKLDVTISTVQQPPLSGSGTFTVLGEGAEYLCDAGTFETVNVEIWFLTEDKFKIRADNVFECDTGETFVLNLKNTIIIGQGGIPGAGKWKLKDATGFDSAPRGKGAILAGELGEIFEGVLKAK